MLQNLKSESWGQVVSHQIWVWSEFWYEIEPNFTKNSSNLECASFTKHSLKKALGHENVMSSEWNCCWLKNRPLDVRSRTLNLSLEGDCNELELTLKVNILLTIINRLVN
jgi:hypothetical protein